MNRFQIYDDFGVIRTFFSRIEATNFISNKPEFKLVTLPKEKKLSLNFDELGECLL